MTTRAQVTGADEIVLALEPTTIAEWDVRDLLSGEPSAALALTTREQAAALLREVVLSLPRLTPFRQLDAAASENLAAGTAAAENAAARNTAARNASGAGHAGTAGSERFDFHVMDLPVGIAVPAGCQLTRLRLGLDARTVGVPEIPLVAYEARPVPGTELTNPVTWDLSGAAITGRFTAHVIWRVPRRVPFKVSASLLGELHGPDELDGDGAGRRRKAQFRSASQYYAIPS
jgi:hypothetical protein